MRTSFVDNRFILYVLGAHGETDQQVRFVNKFRFWLYVL